MTLYGFGTATIDIRISTADYGPDYRAKLLARETRFFGGGAAANSLYQATLLGAESQWFGKLGRDSLGSKIVADLASCRVGTDYVRYDADALSPFNLAVYAGEDSRRVGGFLLPNCLGDVTESDLDYWCGIPGSDDWCLVEVGEIPIPRVLEFCNRLSRSGVSIVLDIDLDPLAQCVGGSEKLFSELLGTADYILPNADSVSSIYGTSDPEGIIGRMYAECGRPIVATAGARGAFFSVDGSNVEHIPAPSVEVIDTVGAGDAFHGGFIWSLMHSGGDASSLRRAVEIGSICGAANCAAFGAREGMLDAKGIEDELAQGLERAP